MPNRLGQEISPYLLQHAENPVDWYPWGEEAFDKARREDRPVFLSIGYAACHWCHVMEHESFENEEIAAFLNENFVSIKVDREERPDLDQIYMQAVMAIRGGHGGWPLSAFLTPKAEVFFGGTYWPPYSRGGMPGFLHVLQQVARAFRDQRNNVESQAAQISQFFNQASETDDRETLDASLLESATAVLQRAFDSVHGGFGSAPKFPHPMDLQLLLQLSERWHSPQDGSGLPTKNQLLTMVDTTLDKMAWGGIYDHLGGGFARYSVDQYWLVPHFEKMLYDNALLAKVYTESYVTTGKEFHGRIAQETIDYVIRDMRDDAGGFHSTEDADSEGEEGKYYVWTPAEIEQILGRQEAELFCAMYGVTANGNFEHGTSILHLQAGIESVAKELGESPDGLNERLGRSRTKLLNARQQRVRPGRDDKIIVSWNAFMIDALARAAGVWQRSDYTEAADQAADFIVNKMQHSNGRLFHAWRQGVPRQSGFLDDYAAAVLAFVSLYETTQDERRIDQASRWGKIMRESFEDQVNGGFYYVPHDHESLIARIKDSQDGSVPSGNALAATALLRLGTLLADDDMIDSARETLQSMSAFVRKAPQAAGQSLIAIDMLLGGINECVVTSDDDPQSVLTALHRWSPARRVLAARTGRRQSDYSESISKIFAGRERESQEVTLYVCQQHQCQAPIHGEQRVLERIQQLKDDVTPVRAGS